MSVDSIEIMASTSIANANTDSNSLSNHAQTYGYASFMTILVLVFLYKMYARILREKRKLRDRLNEQETLPISLLNSEHSIREPGPTWPEHGRLDSSAQYLPTGGSCYNSYAPPVRYHSESSLLIQDSSFARPEVCGHRAVNLGDPENDVYVATLIEAATNHSDTLPLYRPRDEKMPLEDCLFYEVHDDIIPKRNP